MRAFWSFVRRHWVISLIVIVTIISAVNPALAQRGLERIFQLIIDSIVMLIDAVASSVLGSVNKNQNVIGNLLVLAIMFWGFRRIFRGFFGGKK